MGGMTAAWVLVQCATFRHPLASRNLFSWISGVIIIISNGHHLKPAGYQYLPLSLPVITFESLERVLKVRDEVIVLS